MSKRPGVRLFSVDLGADPPTEFRIFQAGVNPTSKGDLLFDDKAAASVMEAWKAWGVDLMIDLEHQSLDADASSRADAVDARGWFKLEVRPGPELWAVGVTWTPDGEKRLREKTQRYISPALFDDEGRVTEIVNAALVAMPATHKAQALVAARRFAFGDASLETVRQAVYAALKAKLSDKDGCGPYVVDIYENRVIFEAPDGSGSLYAIAYTFADGAATLDGDAYKVVRQYVPATVAARLRAARFKAQARKRRK